MKSHRSTPYLFLLPAFALLGTFSFGAMGYALYISFHHWSIVNPTMPFAGFLNYIWAFNDPHFGRAFFNTLSYALMVTCGGTCAALAAALMVNALSRLFSHLVRTALFTPIVTSVIASAIVWQWIYNPTFGLANGILARLGLPMLDWIYSPKTALLSIALMSIWKGLGYGLVLFLAGLQQIPEVYEEAARVDGAGRISRFIHITFPLLVPVSSFVIVTTFIGSFQVFSEPFIMTLGGPGESTMTLFLYLYETAFKYEQMGLACAMAFIVMVAIMLITIASYRYIRREVDYV
ncbi:MAG: sugar ABC transporter permease [bacterium]